jgi:hypothetical protein
MRSAPVRGSIAPRCMNAGFSTTGEQLKMNRKAMILVVLVASALGLFGCGEDGNDGENGGNGGDSSAGGGGSEAATGCKVVARTCDQIKASFEGTTGTVTVTCDDAAGTFMVKSTGVPTYTSNQSTPNEIAAQNYTFVLPITPTCAAAPVDVTTSRGEIGMMVNGIPFYGPEDAQGRNAYEFEGDSFDDCMGHADESCKYHYHVEPRCVFGTDVAISTRSSSDGHPPVVGYAKDGFAVYGDDSSASGKLDSCNGHYDSTRGYHYHTTGTTAPLIIGCYMGETTSTKLTSEGATRDACPTLMGMGMPPGGGMAP